MVKYSTGKLYMKTEQLQFEEWGSTLGSGVEKSARHTGMLAELPPQ